MICSYTYGGFTYSVNIETFKITSISTTGRLREIPLTSFSPNEQAIMLRHMLTGQDITYLEHADIMHFCRCQSPQQRARFGPNYGLLLLAEVYKPKTHNINIIYAEPACITTVTLNNKFYFELPSRRVIRGFCNRKVWYPKGNVFSRYTSPSMSPIRLNPNMRPIRLNEMIIKPDDHLYSYYVGLSSYDRDRLINNQTGETLLFSSRVSSKNLEPYLKDNKYAY